MLPATERPGIYSDYEASGILWGSGNEKQVGIAAANEAGEQNRVYEIQRISDAKSLFGEDSLLAALCGAALQNGAAGVKAVSAGTGDAVNYEKAFAALEAEESVGAVCCGSSDDATAQLLKESVVRASASNKERIGFAYYDGESPEALARSLNCERLVLLCQAPVERPEWGCLTAAAAAGAVVSAGDPAASLHGARLQGITGLSRTFTEKEIDVLLKNGVSVLEAVAGRVELIRAVTTRTAMDGTADRTFHDLNTVLIIDTVIPGIRSVLKHMLVGAKNNGKTRSAIATQTAVKLDDYLRAGMIDSYQTPTVTPSGEDASVCLVEVQFTASMAMNQIVIKAHITV